MLVAARVEDQCSPDLAAGLLAYEVVELFVEVCNRLVAELARECARINGLHGWVSMYSDVGGWTAYCSSAVVSCDGASSRDDGFGSVCDCWTNGFKIRIESTLNHGYFDIVFDVLGQFSRAANVKRQDMLLLQCLPRKVDARLA